MKTVCKKLLSLMLVAMLLVSAIPMAYADEGTEYEVAVNVVTTAVDGTTTTQNLKAPASAGDLLYINQENLVAWGYVNSNATGYTISSTSDCYEITETNYTQIISVNVTNNATSYTLTLHAGDGKIGDATSKNYTVNYGQAVPDVSAVVPTLSGYTFLGWYNGNEQLTSGKTWTYTSDMTFTAQYVENTNTLTVKALYYINGVLADKKTEVIYSKPLNENTKVLTWLHNNYTVPTVAGYTVEDGGTYYNYNGSYEVTDDALKTIAEKTVCVKYNANTYTLYFNANGGSVSPTSKSVTYDAAVGTLPTPTKTGGVFSHWEDENGNTYTSDTVYKVAGNTELIARWENEADVKLAIHFDFEYDSDGAIVSYDTFYVQMNGYIAGEEVYRSAVQKIVTKWFSSPKMSGLYNDAAWADYVAGKDPTKEESVTVSSSCTVHVAVTSGSLSGTGSSSSSSSSGTTGTTDSTNPQTGDGIVLALAAMMSTGGAALVLGKKKFF